MPDKLMQDGLTRLTAELVASYVTNNIVQVNDIPRLISSVHSALIGLLSPKEQAPEKLTPPVSVKRSITPDQLISMEDGKPYKSLKRHLSRLGLTPEQYRRKWGLPSDYPMVAPNYSAQRSAFAKASGLGRKQSVAEAPAPARARPGKTAATAKVG